MGKIRTLIEGASNLEKLFQEEKAIAKVAKKEKDKFPLDLTRAQPKTQKEITEMADRVARQQSGEHVTKKGDTKNLAGRSKKESQRLQELQYTLEPTRELRPTPVYEGKVGDVNMAIPGDQTVSDRILVDVNGLPIGSNQQGGSMYGEGKLDLDDPLFWASGEDVAQQFQNKVTNLSNLYDTEDIMAHHLAMGPVSNNFAMHFADANLRAIANTDMAPEAMEAFNNVIRNGYVDNKGKHIPLPHFVGIENPNEAYLQMMEDSGLRKWFNNRMKIPSITQQLGMPDGRDIQWAITEPELRNMEVNLTGRSVGKMKPGAELTDTADHMTYESGIQGESMGRAPELAPFELSFPDASMYVRGTQRPSDFTGTIQKVFPHQVVDQQHLDEMSKYYEELRRIRGFKEGGEVGLEQEFVNADTIHMAGGGKPKQDFSQPSLGSIAKTLYKTFNNNPQNRQLKETITGMNPVVREFNPFYTVPRGYDTLTKVKGAPIAKAAMNNLRGINDDEAYRQSGEQLMNAGEGLMDMLPVVGAAALGAKPVMKGINKIADMNLPVGLSIKDVSPKTAEFRSSLAKSVNSHKMESMPGAQWASWLQANGSKSAKKEAEATGLYEWLKTQPKVSKYDIEEHIGENLPKINVIEKGKKLELNREQTDELSDLTKRHSQIMHGTKEEPLTDEEMEKLMHYSDIAEMATPRNLRHQADKLEQQAQKMKDEGYSYTAFVDFNRAEHLKERADRLELNPIDYGGTKYKDYQLPGGKNYKETIVTLPPSDKLPEGYKVVETFDDEGKPFYHAETPNTQSGKWRDRAYAEDQLATYAKNSGSAKAYESSHFRDIKNPVLHMRTNERMTPEGKKALFMEELQSDWAQQGRDIGFRNKSVEDYYKEKAGNGPATPWEQLDDNSKAMVNNMFENDSALPHAPYVTDTKDWTALGLKHALKRAVDEGHDVLAWTTGAQQAKRYDLSKQINEVHYSGSDLKVYDHDGNEVISQTGVRNEDLPEYIGKEATEKLLAQPQNGTLRSLRGQELEVGGEGMKGYYDQIVPSTMNDVLKQVGSSERVKPIKIDMPQGLHKNEDHPDFGVPDVSEHLGIEITPELRELILNEGLPHFHDGGEVDARTVKRGKIKPIDLETDFKLSKFKE